MARALAQRLRLRGGVWARTVWVPEFGRELTARKLAALRADRPGAEVWEERYLGSTSDEVRAAVRPADLYLLTGDHGVPFVQDGLRDGEQIRTRMAGRFRQVLDAHAVPWLELSGSHAVRLRIALAACDDLIARGWSFA
jgi:hypothetical protein